MKRIILLFFVILSFTIFSFQTVTADNQTIFNCGGDDESIIPCFGDEESSFLSLPLTSPEEETPVEVPVAPGGGGSGSSILLECIENSQCESDEICLDNKCTKLFDIKILDFQSPIKIGDFFTFTYFIKGMADINDDVTVDFWIEKDGKIITSGSDVIYMGSFEEKTETTRLFLPSSFESGVYLFHVRVTHPSYSAESYRTIEVQIKEGIAEINFIDTNKKIFNISTPLLIAIIIILLVVIIVLLFLRRSRIRSIHRHNKIRVLREVRRLNGKKHKTSEYDMRVFLKKGRK